jgi:hypothetical protein
MNDTPYAPKRGRLIADDFESEESSEEVETVPAFMGGLHRAFPQQRQSSDQVTPKVSFNPQNLQFRTK